MAHASVSGVVTCMSGSNLSGVQIRATLLLFTIWHLICLSCHILVARCCSTGPVCIASEGVLVVLCRDCHSSWCAKPYLALQWGPLPAVSQCLGMSPL
jgi:hypothetical protein